MNFIIVTGLSGAGKSQAKKVFEDLGYYCIDNLPPSLIPNFIELLSDESDDIQNIALVIDVRGGKFFEDLEKHLKTIKSKGYDYKIFYFEANDEVLIKRFKETRRTHPINPTGRIEDALAKEKSTLATLKEKSHVVINTSNMTHSELKSEITRFLSLPESKQSIALTIMSFGFKKGLPLDADFVFDVRFLPNPFYEDTLRNKTGNTLEVQSYVMQFEASKKFMGHIKELLDDTMPHFIKEGRAQLVIAVGCTGGQHRSVTFANILSDYYRSKGYHVNCVHRELSNK